MKSKIYTDLYGKAVSLADLSAEELRLLEGLEQYARTHEQHEYRNHWMAEVARFYSARGLSRPEIARTLVFRVAQDIDSRMRVAAGHARAPDYRDELEALVLSRFPTRRAFCKATGISEDMLSHVLARRKHLAIDTLSAALEKIGYRLHIVPIAAAEGEGPDNGVGDWPAGRASRPGPSPRSANP